MISNVHVRIEAEGWAINEEDAQVDVVVTFPDKTKWMANFYTYECLMSIRQEHKKEEKMLYGNYWTAPNHLVLVDTINRNRIEEVIEELLNQKTFEYVFEFIGSVHDEDLEHYPADFFLEETKRDFNLI